MTVILSDSDASSPVTPESVAQLPESIAAANMLTGSGALLPQNPVPGNAKAEIGSPLRAGAHTAASPEPSTSTETDALQKAHQELKSSIEKLVMADGGKHARLDEKLLEEIRSNNVPLNEMLRQVSRLAELEGVSGPSGVVVPAQQNLPKVARAGQAAERALG